ncbi:uncharacterized protein PF3D7_1120000-like [Procambarus clarkii]|uniref:uncharacterized protein PF3D7_1120000-like n=1 Tax=Procambarus clarkii TaxID=6728 RepID=UPI003742E2B6
MGSGRLEIIEDTQKKFEERVFNFEEENGTLWSEFHTLKRSILQQGQNVTALTDKVKIQEEHIKGLVKENELWKQKFAKDMQRETAFATHIEEVNRELEKYIEKIKETYAQIVKEKETIKELEVKILEVKTRNDKNETEMRQAIRKELVTNSELVQNTVNRTSNTWTKEELDYKGENFIREIVVKADKDKSRLLVIGDWKHSRQPITRFREGCDII